MIPLTITKRVRVRLRLLGLTDDNIRTLKPSDAWSLIGSHMAVSAKEYTKLGWYVFPLNGKIPRINDWENGATQDEKIIDSWFKGFPDSNIGVAAGKSGLIIIDKDTYKPHYDPIPPNINQQTITNLTGAGGEQLFYKMPKGENLGNSTGNLPEGNDVRGIGGYVVVPPSCHPDTGRMYEWEQGYSPFEMQAIDLPSELFILLTAKRNNSQQSTVFSSNGSGLPDLNLLSISELVKNTIRNGVPPGADRSSYDQSVITSLIRTGLSDDEIKAIFDHYDIGQQGKYKEKGKYGEDYLARSITNARNNIANSSNGSHSNNNGQSAKGSYLLKEAGDHNGHAETLKIKYKNKFLYTSAYGWLNYTGAFWNYSDARLTFEKAAIETLKARRKEAVDKGFEKLVTTSRVTSGQIFGIEHVSRNKFYRDVEEFDKGADFLNCQNGLLDLRTGHIQSHNHSQLYTYCIPVDYNPNVDKTIWLDFLSSVVPDEETIMYLKRMLGYSLTGHTREEILVYMYGPTRSGKGTFTETILRMLGRPLSTETDFETFTAKRYGDTQNFDLAGLKPCRFVAASESNKYGTLNPAKIKAATGGNYIRCAFKRKDLFTYKPQFKIWLSSNHPVNVDVDDDAAWARIRVVPFPNSFLGKENKKLKQDIMRPVNLEAVLAWAVEGAIEWYRDGLIDPDVVKNATKKQRVELDYIAQFMEEDYKITNDSSDFVKNNDLYQAYIWWCQQNGYTPKKARGLGRSLSEKGYVQSSKRIGLKVFRGISGIVST